MNSHMTDNTTREVCETPAKNACSEQFFALYDATVEGPSNANTDSESTRQGEFNEKRFRKFEHLYFEKNSFEN